MNVVRLGSEYLLYASPVLLLTHLVIVFESTMRSTNDALYLTYRSNDDRHQHHTELRSDIWKSWYASIRCCWSRLSDHNIKDCPACRFLSYFHIKRHWLQSVSQLRDSATLRITYRRLAIPAVANSLLWAMEQWSIRRFLATWEHWNLRYTAH